MALEIKLDMAALAAVGQAAVQAAAETMEAVKTDLTASQTVPMQNGTLQDELAVEVTPDSDCVHITLGTSQPYSRFLYYGRLMLAPNGSSWAKRGESKSVTPKPLNYFQGKNTNAGPLWYAPYTQGGEKGDFIPETFAARLKEKLQ